MISLNSYRPDLAKDSTFRNYVPYIAIVLILFIIIVCTIIRIKYGFWYYQPVFHLYDLRYYIFPPGIIQEELPRENKFTNFKQIQTIPFKKVTDYQLTQFVNFVRKHYYSNKDNKYSPKKENIVPYFKEPYKYDGYLSLFEEEVLLQDMKDDSQIKDKNIIAVMTSRPLNVFIRDKRYGGTFDVYYVDYLCVHKDYRKKGTAPQIIQTHEYNQRHMNKSVCVSLFKREGELTGIVPLCVYKTYCFSCVGWKCPDPMHASYTIVECTPQNLHLFHDFLKENQSKFNISITTSVSNICELIKSGNVYLLMLLKDGDICAVYFFRNSCMYIANGLKALTCFACICATSVGDFIQGFKHAFWKIAKREKKYGYLVIENISDNYSIIKNIELKTRVYAISPSGYFFYNFAYHTFDSKKVLIIC
jgi:hypothetical protein